MGPLSGMGKGKKGSEKRGRVRGHTSVAELNFSGEHACHSTADPGAEGLCDPLVLECLLRH